MSFEEEDYEDYDATLLQDAINKYDDAACIVKAALERVISECQPGQDVFTLCEMGDSYITTECENVHKTKKNPNVKKNKNNQKKEIPKGIAFPTSISVNNCIRHFSPDKTDGLLLQSGDMVKVEMGCHIDGYMALVAKTHVLCEGGTIEGKPADVIQAAQTVAEVALKLVRPGKKLKDVSAVLKAVAAKYACNIVEGVIVQQLKQFVVHGKKAISIPGTRVDGAEFLENEVYAIDIVIRTGVGETKTLDDKKATIYRRTSTKLDAVTTSKAKTIIKHIEHSHMPFSTRTLPSDALDGVLDCVNADLLQPYHILEGGHDELFAHIKFTVLLISSEPSRWKPSYKSSRPLNCIISPLPTINIEKLLSGTKSNKPNEEATENKPVEVPIWSMPLEVKFTLKPRTDQLMKDSAGWLTGYNQNVKRLQVHDQNTYENVKTLSSVKHTHLLNLVNIDSDWYSYIEFPLSMKLLGDEFQKGKRLCTRKCGWYSFPHKFSKKKKIVEGVDVVTHRFLQPGLRDTVKNLISFLKHINYKNICTARDWCDEDVFYDRYVILGVDLKEFEKGTKVENDLRLKDDIRKLGAWMRKFFYDELSDEVEHMISMMMEGNKDDFPLLVHPALLSHRERGDYVMTLIRDMPCLRSDSPPNFVYKTFQESMELDLVGYRVSDNKENGRKSWQDRIDKKSILQIVHLEEKEHKMDNVSMMRFMGNARTHLIDTAARSKFYIIDANKVDCWLSGTFPMALVLTMQILNDFKCLEYLVDCKRSDTNLMGQRLA